MRFLLDTNIVVAIINDSVESLPAPIEKQVLTADTLYASVVSLWELAIKARLGKLDLKADLAKIPAQLDRGSVVLLNLTAEHAVTEALPVPPTRDPFDRLLLAVAQVEQAPLLTTDSLLAGHPSAWKGGSA